MIGDALRVLRVFHDLAQKDFATKLGIAPSYLSEIESGKKEPTLQLLRKYAEEFRIPLSSILFFSEHLDDSPGANRLRLSVSSKVLALLKFIAVRTGRDAA
jgi:transcriptional regulator with XRE-family HTH domain